MMTSLAWVSGAHAENRHPTCLFGPRDDGQTRVLLAQIAANQQQILANQQMMLMLLQHQQSQPSAPAQPHIIVLGPGLDSAPRQVLPATPPRLDLPVTPPPKIDLPATPPRLDLPATPPRQDLPATPPKQPAQVQTYSKAIWRPVAR
jgi:hypothetical protein